MMLPVPYAYVDFRGVLKVTAEYDNKRLEMQVPNQNIDIPIPNDVQPRVTIQALRNDKSPVGPVYVYAYDADYGRGGWVTFDPELHQVPQYNNTSESEPLLDEGPEESDYDDADDDADDDANEAVDEAVDDYIEEDDDDEDSE